MYFNDEEQKQKEVIPEEVKKEWTETELAYLAGVLDSSHYLVCSFGPDSRSLVITHTSKSQDKADWLVKKFGGGSLDLTIPNGKSLKKPKWNVGLARIAQALFCAYKYQVNNKELSKLFLHYANTMVSTPVRKIDYKALPFEIIQKRREIIQKILDINASSPPSDKKIKKKPYRAEPNFNKFEVG